MSMKLRTLACAAAIAALLAGCDDDPPRRPAPPYPDKELATAQPGEVPAALDGAPAEGAQQQIAYTYSYSFELPMRQVLPLSEQHRTLCEDAGPSQCRIDRATRQDLGQQMNVWIELRAAPEWLAGFRERLTRDVADAKGRIADFKMESEDLSQRVVDTQAYLRAQTTLRDRLQNLLSARTGTVGELLEIERELTRVQGELDSAQARLAHLQTQVAMSQVSLYYGTDYRERVWLGKSASEYFTGLWRTIRDSFLIMITVTVAILPWLPLAALLLWGLRRLWAARKRAKLAAKARKDAAVE